LRFSHSIGIKCFRYAKFNNNDIYNLRDITSVRHILGEGDCVFSAARGAYNYLQVSGGTSLRPTIPIVQCIYKCNSSTTLSGIEMAASSDTNIDLTSPGSDYKGRIKYDNANGKLDFYTNSAATAVLSLSAGLISSTGIISSSNNITTSNGNITTTTGNITTTNGNIQSIQGSVSGVYGSFNTLSITGTTLRPSIPTSIGCYIGQAADNDTAIELCSLSANKSYIDFTQPNTDFKGRIIYNNTDNVLKFHVNSNNTARMILNDTSLTVAGDIKANNFVANSYSLSLFFLKKSDIIQLKTATLMNIIELTPTQTMLYNEVYTDIVLNTVGHIIVGSYTVGPTGWTDKCTSAPTGNITTVRYISAGSTGNITCKIFFLEFINNRWHFQTINTCKCWYIYWIGFNASEWWN